MVITGIKPLRKDYLRICLDGEFFRTIPIEIFIKSNLKVGSYVDTCDLKKLLEESEKYKVNNKAINLLSYRAHSKKELEIKLSRTSDKNFVKSASDRMEKLGLIDDEKFAVECANDLFFRKRYGKSRIKFELVKKGIDSKIIDKVINELDGDELENIRVIIEKRFLKRDFSDGKVYRKIVCFLQRYGYQLDDIIRVINDFKEDS